ncbi:MAG: non-heme iron oxygenase ferredoxin subunit [Methylococcales bacterium]|nr:non-heme iron oxygenase ferredoxin subunit [Methylococcales bacterium]MCK5924449.1 non-heme iron oxygenase ferredoxin subunit [Methylococcales bacterium]
MSDWIDVAAENALANGESIVIDINGVDVAIFKIAGRFFAIEDTCTHDGAEIASGQIDGDEIICPRHGARFCIKTGRVKSAPAYEDVDCFPVQVINGRVQVRDNHWQ